MTEYEQRYESLAQANGIALLTARVPFSREQIVCALERGDEHLNTLPLHMWDMACGLKSWSPPMRAVNAVHERYELRGFRPEWLDMTVPEFRGADSLSARVSLLKHVAIFHIAKRGA